MSHYSRKELKKDEIRDTLKAGADAVMSHQKLMWAIGLAVLAVILAGAGWRFYGERQTLEATAALDEARKIFDARIRAIGEPEIPGETSYVEEKNKFADAAEKFKQVADTYPRTRPGQMARYYAGLSLVQIERFDEAEQQLREVERTGHPELAALARFQLARLYERTGKPDQARQLYQALVDKPATLVPRPIALLALARSQAESNPEEAAKLYEKVRDEYPNTSASDEAQERLLALRPGA